MLLRLAPALAVVILAGPVLAQEGPDGMPAPRPSVWDGWSFEVGAATDNRSKNASKTNGDPFAYVEATWESDDGRFYVAPSAETIEAGGSDLETRITAGWTPEIVGYALDLNVAHKWRIDADPGQDDTTWEFTGNVSRAIGPAKARVQLQYSPDGAGSTEAFTWIEARLGWDLTDRATATAAVGRREQDNAIDYTGWNAGVEYALAENLTLDLRYYDTDADVPGEQYASALVLAIAVGF